jgi:GTP-binding protein Era
MTNGRTVDASGAPPSGETRCGFVAIIGAPNAGKSTLVNQLVGTKVTIVSHKVQTTRMRIRGLAIAGASQLIFIDTPGIFRPRRRLDRAMVEAAWRVAAEADVVVLLVDCDRGLEEKVEPILAQLTSVRRRLLVLNKVDRLKAKEPLLKMAADICAKLPFDRVFMVSALTGDGLADLKAYLAASVPPGPWHYPEDEVSDLPMRLLAAEITREKIFNRLHDELPYATTVETTAWKELKDGSLRIEQTIFVERENQRKIMLGKRGTTIKQISMEARAELAEMLAQTVHLLLFVKVRERWGDDPERYREMGLEFPKG